MSGILCANCKLTISEMPQYRECGSCKSRAACHTECLIDYECPCKFQSELAKKSEPIQKPVQEPVPEVDPEQQKLWHQNIGQYYNYMLFQPQYNDLGGIATDFMQINKADPSDIAFAYPVSVSTLPIDKIPYFFSATATLAPLYHIITGGLDEVKDTFTSLRRSFVIQMGVDLAVELLWDLYPIPDMNKSRYCHKLLIHENFVYAIGGIHKEDSSALEYLSNCECLMIKNLQENIQTQTFPLLSAEAEWGSMAAMNKKRSQFDGFSYGQKLYVFGGYSASGEQEKSIEAYDIASDKWELINFSLSSTISASNLFLADSLCLREKNSDTFYILGGSDGKQSYNTVYSYNLKSNEVDHVCTMTKNRAGAHGFLDAGVLFVFGGEQDAVTIDKIDTKKSPVTSENIKVKDECSFDSSLFVGIKGLLFEA